MFGLADWHWNKNTNLGCYKCAKCDYREKNDISLEKAYKMCTRDKKSEHQDKSFEGGIDQAQNQVAC